MPDLVLWETCRRCTHFTQCDTPFAASGICPHPDKAHRGQEHPLIYRPVGSHRYSTLLQNDGRATSIFHCWRRGKPPTNDDYLYLRALAFENGPPSDPPFLLLSDVLNEVCTRWLVDAMVYYYGVDDKHPEFGALSRYLVEIINGATSLAVLMHGPSSIETYAGFIKGADWTRLILDQIRFATLTVIKWSPLDFSTLNDDTFRGRFEEEWAALLHFQDLFFGFRVIPRIKASDFVRYSLLPHADTNIRGQISNYLVHQWSEYPQLAQLVAPQLKVNLGKRLNRIYQPLIEKTAREALHNSHIPLNDERALADVLAQAWQVFEAAMKKFRFYGPRKRKRLRGKMGIVGLPQTPELTRYFNERAKQKGLQGENGPMTLSDVSEVGFAYYIELKMRAWLRRNYPPEPQSTEVIGGNADNDFTGKASGHALSDQTFTGIDGLPYLQRRAAALVYGVTQDQLRNWDRNGSLPTKRAEQVLAAPLPEGVSKEHRLYPYTTEAGNAVRELKARKETRSTQAKEGECTRKMAARVVGVPATTLLSWEGKGLLHPQKRGSSVIYGAQDIEAARALGEKRRVRSK